MIFDSNVTVKRKTNKQKFYRKFSLQISKHRWRPTRKHNEPWQEDFYIPIFFRQNKVFFFTSTNKRQWGSNMVHRNEKKNKSTKIDQWRALFYQRPPQISLTGYSSGPICGSRKVQEDMVCMLIDSFAYIRKVSINLPGSAGLWH